MDTRVTLLSGELVICDERTAGDVKVVLEGLGASRALTEQIRPGKSGRLAAFNAAWSVFSKSMGCRCEEALRSLVQACECRSWLCVRDEDEYLALYVEKGRDGILRSATSGLGDVFSCGIGLDGTGASNNPIERQIYGIYVARSLVGQGHGIYDPCFLLAQGVVKPSSDADMHEAVQGVMGFKEFCDKRIGDREWVCRLLGEAGRDDLLERYRLSCASGSLA